MGQGSIVKMSSMRGSGMLTRGVGGADSTILTAQSMKGNGLVTRDVAKDCSD